MFYYTVVAVNDHILSDSPNYPDIYSLIETKLDGLFKIISHIDCYDVNAYIDLHAVNPQFISIDNNPLCQSGVLFTLSPTFKIPDTYYYTIVNIEDHIEASLPFDWHDAHEVITSKLDGKYITNNATYISDINDFLNAYPIDRQPQFISVDGQPPLKTGQLFTLTKPGELPYELYVLNLSDDHYDMPDDHYG